MPKDVHVHLVLCYKNFAACAGISHIGLGVAALNIAKVLQRHGIKCTVLPILSVAKLDDFLTQDHRQEQHHERVTHVENRRSVGFQREKYNNW